MSGLYGANLELSNLPDVAAARENLGVGLTDAPTLAALNLTGTNGVALYDVLGSGKFVRLNGAAEFDDNSITFSAAGGDRVLAIGGNLTIGGAVQTSGTDDLIITVTANTNVTLPTTGTLATLAGTETLDNKTLSTLTVTGATVLGDATGDTITLNADAITQPTTVTHTKTAQASTAEVIEKWTMSDDTSSSIRIENAVTTDGVFAPQIRGDQSGTSIALSFKAVITTDTGTSPALLWQAQTAVPGLSGTRPVLVCRNFTTDIFEASAALNFRLKGGATSPTLAGATADIVSIVGVDRVNSRHAAAGNRCKAVQAERGSAIYVGDDALDFAGSIGYISAGGIDLQLSANGFGYATGGGTVTQATSRTTGVTLNKVCGAITTNTTSLAAGATAKFTVTNSTVAATDVVTLSIKSGSTTDQTDVKVQGTAAGSFDIVVANRHLVTAETGAIIINFAVMKAVAA